MTVSVMACGWAMPPASRARGNRMHSGAILAEAGCRHRDCPCTKKGDGQAVPFYFPLTRMWCLVLLSLLDFATAGLDQDHRAFRQRRQRLAFTRHARRRDDASSRFLGGTQLFAVRA